MPPYGRLPNCYAGFVDKSAQHGSSHREHPSASLSFDELAAQQGIAPVEDFDDLIGRPSPEDESAEEFSAMLRAWRREGTGSRAPK